MPCVNRLSAPIQSPRHTRGLRIGPKKNSFNKKTNVRDPWGHGRLRKGSFHSLFDRNIGVDITTSKEGIEENIGKA